ncbi:hypothetical protein ACFOZY_05515 [Chungangia koreensis]|uniref:Uncharacterized protein n=1 Tax=Chungangia koreensis TaxID=752657 RepID=A0ABV8X3Z9_9LACT
MKLRKKYSKSAVTMAMLHGVLMGVAGVLIFGFLLNVSNRMEVKSDEPGTEVTVSGPVTNAEPGNEEKPANNGESEGSDNPGQPAIQFYALQHGVFTSDASAKEFISTDPALQKAAIIPVADQYFIWSEIGVTEDEVRKEDKTGDTFVKSFRLSGAGCMKGDIRVPELLKETELQKLNFDDSVDGDDLPAQWRENIAAVTAFSKDMKIVRAQLLAHYMLKNECLKIEF